MLFSPYFESRSIALTLFNNVFCSGILFLLLCNDSATAGEPITSTTEQGVTEMRELGVADQPASPVLADAPETYEGISPFLRDSTFNGQIRTYFFHRQNFDDSFNEAFAVGGFLAYESGYLANRFRIGASAYTSQRLYGPGSRDGTLLLESGQEGYSVLGQLYADIKITDQLIAHIGRKEYSTPYINSNDSRMTPNTFQGYTLFGKTGGESTGAEWRYGIGYINKIKKRNSDEFEWMSSAAGARVDRGVYAAGFNFQQNAFSIGAMNYYSKDIINIFYTEAKHTFSLIETYKLRLSGQYTNQRSTGDNLLQGYAFSSHQAGVKADLSVGAAVLTMAYTNTTSDSNMQNPWSAYPGYTAVQVGSFKRAGESALMFRAAYDFTGLGLEGFSAYGLWVNGYGVKKPLYNQDEINLNLQWLPKYGALKNFSFRTRYALLSQRGDGPDINEYRLIVNYDF